MRSGSVVEEQGLSLLSPHMKGLCPVAGFVCHAVSAVVSYQSASFSLGTALFVIPINFFCSSLSSPYFPSLFHVSDAVHRFERGRHNKVCFLCFRMRILFVFVD